MEGPTKGLTRSTPSTVSLASSPSNASTAVFTLPVAERVEWIRNNTLLSVLYSVCSVLSIGILPVICLFWPVIRVRMVTEPCKPEEAELAIVKLVGDPEEYAVEVSQFKCAETQENIVSLEAHCQRFSASSIDGFNLMAVPQVPANFPRFLKRIPAPGDSSKSTTRERDILNALYGPNEISVPEVSSCALLVRHALSPLYLFQYFAVTIWVIEGYYVYSVLIFIITVSSIYFMWSESVFNLQRLRALATKTGSVTVLTGDFDDLTTHTIVPDSYLVVGDRMIVRQDTTMPCDCVLISGRVVLDESSLTGESVPVSKSPIELTGLGGDDFPTTTGSRPRAEIGEAEEAMTHIATKRAGSVLSGGTKVKACVGDCVVVCYRTGFRSTKGQLVSILLNPREGFVSFFSDALWVIFFMLMLTTVLYIYIAIELKAMGASDTQVAIKYLDAITIAVPPALTASLTIATAIAIERLKIRQIFVSDTNRVNFAGVISAACFDKTGTLTEENMDFKGCTVVNNPSALGGWNQQLQQQQSDGDGDTWRDVDNNQDANFVEISSSALSLPTLAQQVMATCQNLSLVGYDSTPMGDPLEVELLRATGWTLAFSATDSSIVACPPNAKDGCTILRHFEFTPERLRAASLVKRSPHTATHTEKGREAPAPASTSTSASIIDAHFVRLAQARILYLVKGSPEAIVALCIPSSVPPTVQARLLFLAKRGLRVIAMAARVVDDYAEQGVRVEGLSQDEIEAGGDGTARGSNPNNPMMFLGLLCLSSRLKASTQITVKSLIAADIGVDMITGDHIHTAIAVAQQAGILLPYSAVSNRLYIVDEFGEPGEKGQPIIVDALTDRITTDFSIETLLNAASKCQAQLFSDYLRHMLQPNAALAPNTSVQIACTGRGLESVKRQYPPVYWSDDEKKKNTGLLLPESVYTTMIRYARVFARTKPADKKTIVDELMRTFEFDIRQWEVESTSNALFQRTPSKTDIEGQDVGSKLPIVVAKLLPEQQYEVSLGPYSVLFCGDGANDMSALRAADVGVSLCDAETSVAAPITSKMQTPGSVIDVLIEGRCSLITAYVLVIYMILYGVIQLFMALELYSFGLVPSDYTYLIQDLFFTLVLGIAMALTERADELSWELPPKRFLVWWLLFKLFTQMVAMIGIQVTAIYLLSIQSWYVEYTTDTPLVDSYAFESTVVANVALAQLMIGSVVSTIGSPFRKAWYTNFWHVLALFLQAIWVGYQLFQTGDYFATTWLELEPLPFDFALELLGLIGFNAILSTLLYFLAECFRPPSRQKIQSQLRTMEAAASLFAQERIKMDEAIADELAKSDSLTAKSGGEGDSVPLLSRE